MAWEVKGRFEPRPASRNRNFTSVISFGCSLGQPFGRFTIYDLRFTIYVVNSPCKKCLLKTKKWNASQGAVSIPGEEKALVPLGTTLPATFLVLVALVVNISTPDFPETFAAPAHFV